MSRPRQLTVRVLGVALAVFVLVEANYPLLQPQSQLALFAMLGGSICFLLFPERRHKQRRAAARGLDWLLAVLLALCCGWVVLQTQPQLSNLWINGASLGDRAGAEATIDLWIGGLGLLLVIEATRRCVGVALPILATVFLLYSYFGQSMPGWLFPHRGYSLERIVSQTFLHSQGVFGTALNVMFKYVFLFVLFGALLEVTGATHFVITAAQRLFRRSPGGAAKVAVLSSGLMGSLSGSAVANTATTGTFTIPLMRSSGFRPHVAAGVEAAASSGGALVPPVMGAGAYMMLEIVTPPVTYLQIIRAALLPALIYYLSLFLIVHLYSRRIHATSRPGEPPDESEPETVEVPSDAAGGRLSGLIFAAALLTLIVFILLGFTVFRSVTVALAAVVVLSSFEGATRLGPARLLQATERAASGAVALVCAAACVGIVIGVVTLTGIGSKLPSMILPLAQDNLTAALALIMVSSIVLGMGLPSAVCYLLMATLIGPVLGQLGVVPLAAHLFIFYFGMMSMVTPPVALAAYTAASIAGSNIMRSGLAAFRFALVGFTLPYLFVFRPELLMLGADGGTVDPLRLVTALALAVLGVVPLAASIAGFLVRPLSPVLRGGLLLSSALLLIPGGPAALAAVGVTWVNLAGAAILGGLLFVIAGRR